LLQRHVGKGIDAKNPAFLSFSLLPKELTQLNAVCQNFPGIFLRKTSATGGGRACHKLLPFRDIGAAFSALIGHAYIFYNVSVDNL